jgi:hypothetical protein
MTVVATRPPTWVSIPAMSETAEPMREVRPEVTPPTTPPTRPPTAPEVKAPLRPPRRLPPIPEPTRLNRPDDSRWMSPATLSATPLPDAVTST